MDSALGILIFSEGYLLAFGGLGTRLGTFSSNNEVNQILTLVEGNRRTHLVNERRISKHEYKQTDKLTMPVILDKKTLTLQAI